MSISWLPTWIGPLATDALAGPFSTLEGLGRFLAQAGGAGASAFGQLAPIIIIVVIFYIIVFLPLRKQRKQHATMLEELQKGDKVVTNGGLYAEIVSVDADTVIVKVADNVKLRMMKSAVAGKQGEELTGSTQQ